MGFILIILISILLLNVIARTERMSFDFIPVEQVNASHCIGVVRRLESKYVPYVETYKARKWGIFYKIQKRQNYRIEFFDTEVREMRCCSGYQTAYDHGMQIDCLPMCEPLCVNGDCVSPNTCECHAGYAKILGDHSVCQPECTTSCTNGKCTMPNTCTCDPGYQVTEDRLHCLPICEQNCEENNSFCSAPNNCTCNLGYERNSDICEPVCPTIWKNGDCVAPGIYRCHDGYELQANSSTMCTPVCKGGCVFGTCTAPDTCTCDPGYELSAENVCVPICSHPCVMGDCIMPETCSCDEGYGLLETNPYVCEPICEKSCVDGVCMASGLCKCNDGFYYDGHNDKERACKPYCKIPCEPYGKCVSPDECACDEGYRMIDAGKIENKVQQSEIISACEPICNETCVNGKCSGPDQCTCDSGYHFSDRSQFICEPFCEKSCGSNSTCTAPNICTCDAGFRAVQHDITNSCEPICDIHCGGNGTCSAPNICTCDDGFTNDPFGSCIPFCDSPCTNGTCVAPNTCKCIDGFVSSNDSVCTPFCEINCENAECVAPNECRCLDGFITSENNNTCIETCSRNCSGHGICTREKSCNCSFGWSGENCEKPTVCILMMNSDDEDIDKITVRNETNSTLVKIMENAPYCYQCNESLSNETLCYIVHANDTVPAVSCFLSTELPCYMNYRFDKTFDVTKVAGPLAAIAILIITGVSMMAFYTYRKHQTKDLHPVIVQQSLVQETIADELLLVDEDEEISLE